MIGFNGTYLPAASHGNMRITAASIGGQWVMGGKWLTHATQQAIIAAFGAEEGIAVITKTNDYLNAIALTDTTRAQQIANFINEDPLLVCSLVETSKTRWLVGDGKAWINTGIKQSATYAAIETKFVGVEAGSFALYGAAQSADYSQFSMFTRISSGYLQVRSGYWQNEIKLPINLTDEYTLRHRNIGGTVQYASLNGGAELTSAVTQYNNNFEMYLFASNYGNKAGEISKAKMAYYTMWNDNDMTPIANFAPFIRNGENGMLDILSGTFHPNANTEGQFTIALTDKTPA